MVQRHHGDAVVIAGQRLQRGREHGRVEHIRGDHLDAETAGREPGRHLAEIGLDLLHEGVRPRRHHEGKAAGTAAGELGGGDVRLEGVALDRRLDPPDRIGPHARAVVQDAVDRRKADTRLAGDVLQRQRGRGESIGHG
ncbi:hypothetical protein ACVWZ3_008193 [Bradyrhizobium sp. i1.3.6]